MTLTCTDLGPNLKNNLLHLCLLQLRLLQIPSPYTFLVGPNEVNCRALIFLSLPLEQGKAIREVQVDPFLLDSWKRWRPVSRFRRVRWAQSLSQPCLQERYPSLISVPKRKIARIAFAECNCGHDSNGMATQRSSLTQKGRTGVQLEHNDRSPAALSSRTYSDRVPRSNPC